MEETDFKICLKKINKDQKNTKNVIVKQINQQQKNILFFSLYCIKLENQVLIFDKQCINKNTFHKDESIDKVETRRIVLSKKDLYGK